MNSPLVSFVILFLLSSIITTTLVTSSATNCTEPLLLMWYGPFRPTGGSNEDSNAPLTFLHGLWNEIHSPDRQKNHNNEQQQELLPSLNIIHSGNIRKVSQILQELGGDDFDEDDAEEFRRMFPQLSYTAQQLFSMETAKYIGDLMQNLSVPVTERIGERQPLNDASSRRCEHDIDNKKTKKNFAVRMIGAINFALNSRDGYQHGSFLPPSHITEFVASWKIGQGQGQLTVPHQPELWLPHLPDPFRIVVVCQALSPKQWSNGASGFPADAQHFSGLCPPVKGVGARVRIGRIAPQTISELLTFSPSSIPKSWIKRIIDMDQVWVTTLFFKNKIVESGKRYGFKTNLTEKIRVVPEPIDTEIWRRDDLFFLEAHEKVMSSLKKKTSASETKEEDDDDVDEEEQEDNTAGTIDPAWWRSSAVLSSQQSSSTSSFSFATKMNRNLEILQRIANVPADWLQHQRMQSSPYHQVRLLNSTNLDRESVFAVPPKPGMYRDDNYHDHQKRSLSLLPHGYFFFEATEAPDFFSQLKRDTFSYLLRSEVRPRIFSSVFSWKAMSGWDVTLRTFLENFGGSTVDDKDETTVATNPVLILRTAGVTTDEFALDVPRTLELFVEMLYSAEEVTSNSPAGSKSFFNMQHQEMLFDQQKRKAKAQEAEWWEELISLRGGKLSRQERVKGPKRVPVPDGPLALTLAKLQRLKMEQELKENPQYFINLCNKFCPQLPQTSSLADEHSCEVICSHIADSSANWRAFMRRRLFSPILESKAKMSGDSGSKLFADFRTPNEQENERTVLNTRPHLLVLLSSTSASSRASHYDHDKMQAFDLPKYQTLLASSDVVISTGRGETNSFGELLRPLQEASALAVPAMFTATCGVKTTELDGDFLNEETSFVIPLKNFSDYSPSRNSKIDREYMYSHLAKSAGSKNKLLNHAEPDTFQVAEMLNTLANETATTENELLKKGLAARRVIVEKYDALKIGKDVVELVEEVASEEGMEF